MLLERDEPLAVLEAALRDAARGRGRTLLISGEAGVGKTSLLETFSEHNSEDVLTLWGLCEPLATPRPLGPVHDIAAALGGALLAAFAESRPPHELFQTCLAALCDLPKPPLMIIEDAHWCDGATADFVRFVARRIVRHRALLVVTCRDEEVYPGHPFLRAIGDVPVDHFTRVGLRPLSAGGVDELATRHGRALPDLYRLTGGNPLLATELLRSEGVPATLRDSLLARIDRLSPAARNLAEFVAVIPDRAERSLVVAAFSDAEALRECLEQRWLIGDREHVRYRHEVVRRVLEDAMPPRRREEMHARVLDLLARQPPPVRVLARLVHHAEGASDAQAILHYASLAGEDAIRSGAHAQAAAFYEAALEHAGGLASRQRGLLLDKLAWAAFSCGLRDKALEANQRAWACWREAGDSFAEGRNRRARFDFGEFSNFPSDRAGFGDAIEDAVRLLEPHGASIELAMAYASHAMLLSLKGRHEEAEEIQRRSISMAESLGDPDALSHVLLIGERRRNSFFRAADAAQAARALKLALDSRNDTLAAQAYVFCALFALLGDRPAVSERFIAEGLQFVAQRDFDWQKWILLAFRARLDVLLGAWDAAERNAEALLGHAELPGLAEFYANACLGMVRCRRGDARGEAQITRAFEIACSKIASPTSRVGAHMLVAEMHWLRGDEHASLAHARKSHDEAAAMGFPSPAMERCSFWLGLAAGENACARHIPETPYEAALALFQGEAADRRRAFDILEELGASATARRCREVLVSRGVRGVPRGVRATTRANAGLTTREVEVLRYLEQGLANAEISMKLHRSVKTVGHHVSAIIGKLGARNRQQAVRIARGQGLLDVENREVPRTK